MRNTTIIAITAAIMAITNACYEIPKGNPPEKGGTDIPTDIATEGMPVIDHRITKEKNTPQNIPWQNAITENEQELLLIPTGNYSGIAFVRQNADSTYRFVVVDDKKPGGGLLWLDIAISGKGAADGKTASMTLLPGTERATNIPDNEGVAYDGTSFWVSSEGDQQIRQYDMDGNPTGRTMSIPEDMRHQHITPNRGFEALTYDAATKTFWTTTEMPLKEDSCSNKHKLQAFDSAGYPTRRYTYFSDNPSVDTATAAKCIAYVYGIPAMTALQDGKILILEREVYVPEEIRDGWSRTKIYLASPTGQNTPEMTKTLLTEFYTGCDGLLPWLANYEGMCLGPVLDGKQSIILISDSQNGMESLLKFRISIDYIKILLLNTQ